jgi:hypothetical protein
MKTIQINPLELHLFQEFPLEMTKAPSNKTEIILIIGIVLIIATAVYLTEQSEKSKEYRTY